MFVLVRVDLMEYREKCRANMFNMSRENASDKCHDLDGIFLSELWFGYLLTKPSCRHWDFRKMCETIQPQYWLCSRRSSRLRFGRRNDFEGAPPYQQSSKNRGDLNLTSRSSIFALLVSIRLLVAFAVKLILKSSSWRLRSI